MIDGWIPIILLSRLQKPLFYCSTTAPGFYVKWIIIIDSRERLWLNKALEPCKNEGREIESFRFGDVSEA